MDSSTGGWGSGCPPTQKDLDDAYIHGVKIGLLYIPIRDEVLSFNHDIERISKYHHSIMWVFHDPKPEEMLKFSEWKLLEIVEILKKYRL